MFENFTTPNLPMSCSDLAKTCKNLLKTFFEMLPTNFKVSWLLAERRMSRFYNVQCMTILWDFKCKTNVIPCPLDTRKIYKPTVYSIISSWHLIVHSIIKSNALYWKKKKFLFVISVVYIFELSVCVCVCDETISVMHYYCVSLSFKCSCLAMAW